MKGSLRNFLLINLLFMMVLAIVLTASGNYYFDSTAVRNHLDMLLGQTSINFEAFLGNDFRQRNLNDLQNSVNQIPEHIHSALAHTEIAPFHTLSSRYQFQIWDEDGKRLLLHSVQAPKESLFSNKIGLSDATLQGTKWRLFTIYNKNLKVYIVFAEKYNVQTLLIDRITIDDIYIMIIIYSFSAFLIWIIVETGLASLRRLSDEVSHRVPSYLEPVSAEWIPKELKPLVVELNKLFMRLHQALEREKRFAGDAAHELRTPLAALKTQTQVALKSATAEERVKLLENVILATDRCTHIVQQLLTLSRLVPESDSMVDTVALDLGKLAAEVVAQLAPLALNKNIDIELITDDDHPAIVQGNLTALGILIRNLVDNAIRYTTQDGKISIHVARTFQGSVVLKVIDNGPGIPIELRSRVLERFYRVLGNKSPGSGLGLAIVQQIVHLHSAELRLETAPNGKGLEVDVTFTEFKA